LATNADVGLGGSSCQRFLLFLSKIWLIYSPDLNATCTARLGDKYRLNRNVRKHSISCTLREKLRKRLQMFSIPMILSFSLLTQIQIAKRLA
jgi:hypothetical protein